MESISLPTPPTTDWPRPETRLMGQRFSLSLELTFSITDIDGLMKETEREIRDPVLPNFDCVSIEGRTSL